MEMPSKKYRIIYADPPWNFENWSEKGEDRNVKNHYSCMSMKDIAALPVGDMAEDDALLFLWVTDPLMDQQIAIMQGWGFTYKTVAFTWVKLNANTPGYFMGMGYYTRSNPEMVLLGRRGTPGRPVVGNIRQLVVEPRREHSRKPDIIRDNIDAMYPTGDRIELFARSRARGWDAWGNQVDKFTGLDFVHE